MEDQCRGWKGTRSSLRWSKQGHLHNRLSCRTLKIERARATYEPEEHSQPYPLLNHLSSFPALKIREACCASRASSPNLSPEDFAGALGVLDSSYRNIHMPTPELPYARGCLPPQSSVRWPAPITPVFRCSYSEIQKFPLPRGYTASLREEPALPSPLACASGSLSAPQGVVPVGEQFVSSHRAPLREVVAREHHRPKLPSIFAKRSAG